MGVKNKFSVDENERQQAQEAAVVKIAAVLSQPEPTPAPVTTFGQLVAVGRGRRHISAIGGAAAAVNPRGPSAASAVAEAQSEVSAVDVSKMMRKTEKKLLQIQHLVERQKTGETFNEEDS